MSKQNNYPQNNNIEEEEIEENGNKEEFEEEAVNQVNEEEDQEFSVAFDIQINEGSFILLVGKTDEKKLILRLVDKEDDSKPFYQNEFSLEELREINSIFNNFTNENDIINYIIKQLNESEKELEIIDNNNIKLSLLVNEKSNKTQIDFVLIKVAYILEGEEEIQEITKNNNINGMNKEKENGMEEGEEEEIDNLEEVNEEGTEEVENENDQLYNNNQNIENEEHIEEPNMEYSEENVEKSEQKENNITEKINGINKNINSEQTNSPTKNIIKNDKTLQTIIEDTNENIIMSPELNKHKKEILIINKSNGQNEIQVKKEIFKSNLENFSPSKISKNIEQLKENLDSFGRAVDNLEQPDDEENDQEKDNNDNKIKKQDLNSFKNSIVEIFEKLSDNFNNQIQKQNDYFMKLKNELNEKNENEIKEMKKEINKKDIQINEIKNILNEKVSTLEKKINELNRVVKSKESSSQNINSMNNNNKEINKDKTQLKFYSEKINNIVNRLKQNELNYSKTNNLINSLDIKVKNCESKIRNMEGLQRGDKEKIIIDKISNIENKSKNFESQINNLKNNQNFSKDRELYEKLNNLEKNVKQMQENRKKYEINMNKNIDEMNNSNIINKINDLINWSIAYEKEIKNNNNRLEHLNRRLNILENRNVSSRTNEIKQDKNQNEVYHGVSINIGGEKINEKERTSETSSHKKFKKVQKKSVKNNVNSDNDQKENEIKNYRVIKNIEENYPKSKKYNSQTFNKSNKISSYTSNNNTIKTNKYLEKNNNKEYQSLTRPRSRSKEHERNSEIENSANSKSLRQKKYKDFNPPIPKEYEDNVIESKIIEYDDIIFIENRIKEIYPKNDIYYNLVYRASVDGDKSLDFHNKCDKIGPNLTFIKTKKGFIFGGFTAKNWEHLKRDININKPNLGSASRDAKAFGFCVSLQKIYNNERPDEFAIWCNRNFGPTFKNNFFQIFDNCFKRGGYCSLKKNSHFAGQEYDYEISGGESKFGVEDIEVYEIQIH